MEISLDKWCQNWTLFLFDKITEKELANISRDIVFKWTAKDLIESVLGCLCNSWVNIKITALADKDISYSKTTNILTNFNMTNDLIHSILLLD